MDSDIFVLLRRMREGGLKLFLRDGAIRVGPHELVTEEIRRKIRDRRSQLQAALLAEQHYEKWVDDYERAQGKEARSKPGSASPGDGVRAHSEAGSVCMSSTGRIR